MKRLMPIDLNELCSKPPKNTSPFFNVYLFVFFLSKVIDLTIIIRTNNRMFPSWKQHSKENYFLLYNILKLLESLINMYLILTLSDIDQKLKI